MLYTVSGTYSYHDGTGEIVDYGDAVVDIESFNAGALFSYTQFSTSTRATVASNRKSVSFTGTFSIKLHYNSAHIPGTTWWSEDFGPYSGSVSGAA